VPHALSAPAMRLLTPPAANVSSAVPVAPPLTPAPAPRPAPRVFADAVLSRLAAELLDDLGPMAECIVRRAAAQGDASVDALLLRVANEALPASRRGAFIEHLRVVLAQPTGRVHRGPATHPPTGVVVPVLNEVLENAAQAVPLDERLLHQAEQMLTQHVGPMAALLVRRAAAGAATRDQFIARLAGLAGEGRERGPLLKALRRL
jgi:eukaryotic-like serine/threonine-protein kinase